MITDAKVIQVGCDPEAYHAFQLDPTATTPARGEPGFVMSRGELMEFAKCPSRWKAGYGLEDSGDTASTKWGGLIDCLLLDTTRFNAKYAVAPKTYRSEKGEIKDWNFNATFCKEWREDQGKKTVIKEEQKMEAEDAVAAIYRDRISAEFIGCSQKQVFVLGNYLDKETGVVVPLKCLLDLVPDVAHPDFGKSLGDFKTAADASPGKWAGHCYNYGYDAQAALYTDLYKFATKEERWDWRHVIQENFFPWQTARRILTEQMLDIGRAKYLRAIKAYASCVKYDVWPDYDTNAQVALNGWQFTAPDAWMITRMTESMATIGYIPPEPEGRPEREGEVTP